jgi:hypothetical protein
VHPPPTAAWENAAPIPTNPFFEIMPPPTAWLQLLLLGATTAVQGPNYLCVLRKMSHKYRRE